MVKFSGFVTVAETQVPVPNLLVRVTSVSGKEGSPKEVARVSLGTDITRNDGSFEIGAIVEGETGLVGVVLTVSPPVVRSDFDTCEPIIYSYELHEVHPGTQQKFTIRISAAELEKHDVFPRRGRLGAKLEQVIAEAEASEAAVMAALSGRVNFDLAREKAFDQEVLSNVLDKAVQTTGAALGQYKYVVDATDEMAPGALARLAIKDGIDRIRNEGSARTDRQDQHRRKTRFFFNPEQFDALNDQTSDPSNPPDDTFQDIGESALFDILDLSEAVAGVGLPTEATKEQELFDAFLTETREEACMDEFLSPATTGDPDGNDPAPDGDTPIADRDSLLKLLSETVEDIRSPRDALTGSDGKEDGLAEAIQKFAIPVGPADEPRVFDFSALDVAFDDVWQTVTDRRLEPLARSLYVKTARVFENSVASEKLSSLDELKRTLDTARRAPEDSAPGILFALNNGKGPMRPLDDGVIVLDPDVPLPPLDDDPIRPDVPVNPGGVITWHDPSDTGKPDTNAEPEELVDQLDAILREPHAFTAFGADGRSKAINFGLVVGYRHIMTPVTYQVGDLVKTVTLAPNESREYTTRMTTTRKRAEKEVIKNNSIRRDELSEINRAESEIVRKALAKTNFSLTSDGTYNLGLSKGTAKTASGRDGETASNEVKKGFREAVVKASEELRRERSMEVSFESDETFEETSKGRIENTNNELTLTYLFFELQRRFRVNETIQKATPVILVAQDVPAPDEINNTFLVRHAWVLRRALLDDGFAPALEYVEGKIVGDRLDVVSLGETLAGHRKQTADLRTQLVALEEQAGRRYEALVQAVNERLAEEGEEESDGFFSDIGDSLFGGGQETGTARLREEAARDAEERAAQKAKRMAVELQRAVNALNEATEAFNRANNHYQAMAVHVAQLRIHVKENILYYMQAIWSHEVDDQRFLRLYRQPVPTFVRQNNGDPVYRRLGEAAGITKVKVSKTGTGVASETLTAVDFELVPSIDILPPEFDQPLVEVADPGRLLGFLGNYLIFPMTQSNALTDMLLNPYLDEGLKLLDPHDPGNITRPEFAKYVCDLRERLTVDEFEDIREALSKRYRELLLSSEYAGDEIVVPSGALYMEALPGSTPLLESFKLAHRAFDLVGAQEEARQRALENLRRAARLVEGEHDDPETDARYDFYGAPGVVTPTEGGISGDGSGAGGDNG